MMLLEQGKEEALVCQQHKEKDSQFSPESHHKSPFFSAVVVRQPVVVEPSASTVTLLIS